MNLLFSHKNISLGSLVLSTILPLSVGANQNCVSPQFFFIHASGTVSCSFDGNYYGIYWYDAADSGSVTPFISYEKDKGKRGTGFVSGEFDLLANGSLVINSVSLQHEHKFRVLMLSEKYGGSPEIELVDVYVQVRPPQDRPFIAGCGKQPICYKKLEPDDLIECTITDARPAVNLTWVSREANIDMEVPSYTYFTQISALYSTNTTTAITSEMFQNVSLVLLVCQARSSLELLQSDESLLLVDFSGRDLFSVTSVTKKYVLYQEETKLTCPFGNLTFFVWKKQHSHSRDSMIFYDFFDSKMSDEYLSQNYKVDKRGSLIIPNTNVDDEGLYGCFAGDGAKEEDEVYDVKVCVSPTPSFPVVEGCNSDQYCALEIDQTGTLTCTLYGIRPLVDLEWRVYPKSRPHIMLSDKQVKITNNGITYDIALSTHFTLTYGVKEQIAVECKATESDSGLTGLVTKVDLLPPTDYKNESTTPTNSLKETDDIKGSSATIQLVIAGCILVVVVVMVVLLVLRVKAKKIQKPTTEDKGSVEEMQPVLPPTCETNTDDQKKENEVEDTSQDKFRVFKKQLRAKYERLYKSVQPLPYLKDRIYCVNDLFVKLGMKHLCSKGTNKDNDIWKELSSYRDMFTITEETMKRILIEGDPGYGKSTLTTQILYDWCNPSEDGSLQNIDILILLHLRKLSGKYSIYQTIKSLLLAEDTELTDGDIKSILQERKSSLCFVFDGFDEYKNYATKGKTDIKKIIQGDICMESLVIITTRTNIVPPDVPPQTVRIRLTGFDDSARREYIKKAIFGSDEKASENIQEKLKGNPILGDLCEVPLFFAIFAHMTQRGEDTKKLNTVTSFFRFMISCFHRHLENKLVDEGEENNKTLSSPKEGGLEKLAFEGLHGKEQTIIWNKNDLYDTLGDDEYNIYAKIGILVEEEVVEVTNEDITSERNAVQNKINVRFYHKLFCEWYAAKHLAKLASKGSKADVQKELHQIDYNNLQYVYRFACGLNIKAADRIVKFLDESNVNDQFMILCINEQPELLGTIEDTVKMLCSSNPIILDGNNDSFLQRCLTQFLHISSKQQIPIESVWIRNAFKCFETERNCLLLNNGVALNNLETLRQLHLHEEKKNFGPGEIGNILKYAQACCSLTELWFHLCLVPFSFEEIMSDSRREVKTQVIWSPSASRKYILNLSSGFWQGANGKDLKTTEYGREEKKWIQLHRQHSTGEQA